MQLYLPISIIKTPSYLATFQLINLTLKKVLKKKIKSIQFLAILIPHKKIMASHLSSLSMWPLSHCHMTLILLIYSILIITT